MLVALPQAAAIDRDGRRLRCLAVRQDGVSSDLQPAVWRCAHLHSCCCRRQRTPQEPRTRRPPGCAPAWGGIWSEDCCLMARSDPGLLLQAAADAKGAADAQTAWLRANMGRYFSRKLLSVVRRIERYMGLHDNDPGHHFPRLAGSYLTEVRSCRTCCSFTSDCCCTLDQVLQLLHGTFRRSYCILGLVSHLSTGCPGGAGHARAGVCARGVRRAAPGRSRGGGGCGAAPQPAAPHAHARVRAGGRLQGAGFCLCRIPWASLDTSHWRHAWMAHLCMHRYHCTMIGCVPMRTCGRPPVGRAPVLPCPVLAWSIQYMRGVGRSRQAPQATVVKTVPHSAGLSCCAPAQEPCRSYVLRDVICMYCNHCTDLDLCRDPALQVGRQSM